MNGGMRAATDRKAGWKGAAPGELHRVRRQAENEEGGQRRTVEVDASVHDHFTANRVVDRGVVPSADGGQSAWSDGNPGRRSAQIQDPDVAKVSGGAGARLLSPEDDHPIVDA